MNAQFDYGPLRNTADRLLARFGRDMRLTQADADDVYDPISGDIIEGPEQPIDITIRGVTLAPTEEYAGTVGFENIQKGDVLLYIQATARPTLSSTISFGDKTWQVVNVQPIQPAELPLMYIVQVR